MDIALARPEQAQVEVVRNREAEQIERRVEGGPMGGLAVDEGAVEIPEHPFHARASSSA